MIEWEDTKTGARVPRWKGRLMASRLDPEAEAGEWYRRRKSFVDRVKTIFILGVGGGFHAIEVLRRTSAKVIVIEPEAELGAAVMPPLLEKFGERIKLVCVQRAADLRSNEDVRSALGGSFVVLEHPASVAGYKEFFSECSGQLIGRDWGALTWQWKLKGFADLDSEPKVSRSETPLSIYDLDATQLARESTEREKMIIKALRELVK